jgi:predicted secreted protein
MRTIFQNEGTDAVLLIDASNAFNCLNRAVALHNIQVTCPILATYLVNTYRHPAKLFIAGGKTILSMEGTTQGDPLAMPWYSLSTTTLINSLRASTPEVKQVWLADDASAAGKLEMLNKWYKNLELEGKNHGYYVNGGKSWLIVKDPEMEEHAKEIFGDTVNITTEGKRHLGAVIGSDEYKRAYCEEKIGEWIKELTTLGEFAQTHPHMAYAAYQKGYKSKFTYFLRTIENFHMFVTPLDMLVSEEFIPSLFGYDTPLAELRELLSLNPAEGGLGIPVLANEAQRQHASSMFVTQAHVESIIGQETQMRETCNDGRTTDELRKECKKQREQDKKEYIERIDGELPTNTIPFVNQARDRGASSWLNALPIEELKFVLNKEEFRDALRLRYNLDLENLPTTCPCGKKFDVTHALSCGKGGFVIERHDSIKNTLTTLLTKVCLDVEAEPELIPITKETFINKTANTSDGARPDIKAKSFWQRGQTAFFDIRVTHVNSQSQKHQTTAKIFRNHEMSKKREYMQRILDVENGSFTPLVFGTNGGLGEECERFLSTLATKIAEKEDESYAQTITWIRTRLSFEILRAAITCIRGSRVPFRKNNDNELRDFDLMNIQGGLRVN